MGPVRTLGGGGSRSSAGHRHPVRQLDRLRRDRPRSGRGVVRPQVALCRAAVPVRAPPPLADLDPRRLPAHAARYVHAVHPHRQPHLEHDPDHHRVPPRRAVGEAARLHRAVPDPRDDRHRCARRGTRRPQGGVDQADRAAEELAHPGLADEPLEEIVENWKPRRSRIPCCGPSSTNTDRHTGPQRGRGVASFVESRIWPCRLRSVPTSTTTSPNSPR